VRAEVVAQQKAPEAVYELDKYLPAVGHAVCPAGTCRRWPRQGETPCSSATRPSILPDAQASLEAALTLLKAAGIEPILIGRGRSNGYPGQLAWPDRDRPQYLAQANLADLQASLARALLVL
jgi:hypothetical protein